VLGCDLRPHAAARFPIEIANLLNGGAAIRLFDGAETLIHLAGHSDCGRAPDEQVFTENVALAKNVLALAVQQKIKRIVFASSCQVCSGMTARAIDGAQLSPLRLPLDGDSELRPANAYARSKAAVEEAFHRQCAIDLNLSALSLRLPWVVPAAQLPEAMWYRTALQFRCDAFAFLTLEEAVRLFSAAIGINQPGYTCHFAAQRENLLLWPTEKVHQQFFRDVPLSGSDNLLGFVNFERIAKELGWRPEPLPWLRGPIGAARRLRVRLWQFVSIHWPTARRRLRESRSIVSTRVRRLSAVRGTGELWCSAAALHGESPVWIEETKRLVWVDLLAGTVESADELSRARTTADLGAPLSSVTEGPSGTFVVTQGNRVLSIPGDLVTRRGRSEGRIIEGPPNRLNDAKCDSAGRLWITSVHVERLAFTGTLFCLHADGRIERKREGLGCPNGPAWSPDGKTLYLCDSATGNILAMGFDPETGAITEGRNVLSVPRRLGSPDGICVDQEGFLWTAVYGGGRVLRIDTKRGQIAETWAIPAQFPTSCAFGGSDKRSLFVTTACNPVGKVRTGAESAAGSVFVCRVGVPGTPVSKFSGLT